MANDLIGTIAKNFCGSVVKGINQALISYCDYAINYMIDNRLQSIGITQFVWYIVIHTTLPLHISLILQANG